MKCTGQLESGDADCEVKWPGGDFLFACQQKHKAEVGTGRQILGPRPTRSQCPVVNVRPETIMPITKALSSSVGISQHVETAHPCKESWPKPDNPTALRTVFLIDVIHTSVSDRTPEILHHSDQFLCTS